VQLSVPADSAQGRKLRLKGKGIPGKTPGDLYVLLQIVMPASANAAQRKLWQELARACEGFDPRADLGAK
jgi:curved DNA-binding protein